MAKPTGFLDYDRREDAAQLPLERTAHFQEFHAPLQEAERRRQAARCMDCGVPFCQAGCGYGCPLSNLIPEWNDMLFRGSWEYALKRLLKTNNFPEFTGRVCPALCEASCSCAQHGQAVTVRENELYLAEKGFAEGVIVPYPPSVRTGKRVAVVGSGPSGLAIADLLNRRGHAVTVFEKSELPGGLLEFGIPNMKLEKRIVARRVHLMEQEGVVFQCGAEVGKEIEPQKLLAEFDAVALCCGAAVPRDLKIPGRDAAGVHFAVDYLAAQTRALLAGREPALTARGKRVVVVGGGDTGNDCVGTALRQGCRDIVQLEMMPCPPVARPEDNPWPQWPRTLRTGYGLEEARALLGRDIRQYQVTIQEIQKSKEGALRGVITVALQPQTDEAGHTRMTPLPGSENAIPCELLLIAAGFTGCDAALPRALGLGLDQRGNLAAVEHRTAHSKVFTAGDMRTGQSLVARAMADARAAAARMDQYLMGYTNLK